MKTWLSYAATLLGLAACMTDARVAGASEPAASQLGGPAGGGIELNVTLSPWASGPIDCGTDSTLGIHAGDTVGICYTVTNHSGHELDWHYLDTVLSGSSYFFAFDHFIDQIWNQPLPDGQSLQFTEPARTWTTTDLAATWTAEDAPPPGYTFDDTAPFDFADLTTSPTATVLLQGDTGQPSADAQLPFTFRFYEEPAADLLCVGFRGVAFVGQPGCDPTPSDSNFEEMPIAFSRKLIAPAWTIWNSTLTGGTVYADTQGVAPNRRFIVEWYAMTRDLPGPGITFEIVIDEATSEITFEYQSMAFDDGGDSGSDYGGNSTSGIQRDAAGVTPDHFTQYSWWEQVLTDGKAIRWTPAAMPYSATATATATIEVLAPEITVNPTALTASAAAGASMTVPLTIGNSGNTDLSWTLEETPSATGFHIASAHVVPSSMSIRDALPAHADPRRAPAPSRRTATGSSAASPRSILDPNVPAYAIAYGPAGSRYVSLDASDPQTLVDINTQVSLDAIQVGSFVDNDFTMEYLFSNGGCGDNGCSGFEFSYVKPDADQGNSGVIGLGGQLAPTVVGELWHGMKWDATEHTLFAVGSTDGPPSQTDLYSIDPHTGVPTWIARVDDAGANGTKFLDIAIAPNGNMYGIDEWTDTLFAIDKTNGHIASIGATGLDAGNYDTQSMDFDQSTGVLYYAGFPLTPTVSGMYTVDLATGSAQLIAPINGGTDSLRAFSIAVAGGPCTNPQDISWLSLDRTTGTTAAGASENVNVIFNAANLASGTYTAKICVSNNTPFDSTVALPVQFTVGDLDRLFANGFDGP